MKILVVGDGRKEGRKERKKDLEAWGFKIDIPFPAFPLYLRYCHHKPYLEIWGKERCFFLCVCVFIRGDRRSFELHWDKWEM